VQIRRLKIKNFRGIKELAWCPGPGLNCLTGPADAGKSTILEAISMALSPAPGRVASEYDYFGGAIADGFVVEALVGKLDDKMLSAWPVAPLYTWMPETQTVQSDPDPAGESVLCIRAQGTEDLEVEHVLVDPSEGTTPLSPSKRQLFGLSTIGPATTAFRELRMSRGSLLERNVDREQLRGLITEAMQTSRSAFEPPDDVKKRLGVLSDSRSEIAPGTGNLTLAMLSPRGQNLLGMLGLFSQGTDATLTPIPLLNTGLGTQQLTLFTLASSLIVGTPLFVVDELESGLEPFRQRDLVARIRSAIGDDGQAFVTSHSPAAVSAIEISEMHRVDAKDTVHRVVAYPASLGRMKDADPEALLCRLPVLVEGLTEQGLLTTALDALLAKRKLTLDAFGIRLIDGGGQPHVFPAVAALRSMAVRCGAFLDSEHSQAGKRQELAEDPDIAFGTYVEARCLEEALASSLPLEALDELVALPGAGGRDRTNARYQQLTSLAGEQSRKRLVDLRADMEESKCRDLFAQAANRHEWFKGVHGGAAVGRHLIDHHPDSAIVAAIQGFLTAIEQLLSATASAPPRG
jgi:putative ATP-dependent endonuclease of OLD family